MTDRASPQAAYRRLAEEAASRSHAPYSGRKEAVILVLEDGTWLPGVRVESATFSLTIPPLLNALTSAVALEAGPIVAAASSRAFEPSELVYAKRAYGTQQFDLVAPNLLAGVDDLPEPAGLLSPFVEASIFEGEAQASPGRVEAGVAIAGARRVAERAYVPASDFPVGCLLAVHGRGFVPGVNVEHPDWMHILCSERNALGTAVSYGLDRGGDWYLTCPRAHGCTPCGACRQLIAELAPSSTLWMDRGDQPPSSSVPITLIPGLFTGDQLSRGS